MKNKNWPAKYPLSVYLITGALWVTSLPAHSSIRIKYKGTYELTKLIVDQGSIISLSNRSSTTNDITHAVTLYGPGWSATYTCNQIKKTPIGYNKLPKDRTDPKWVQYDSIVTNSLSKCSYWYFIQQQGDPDLSKTRTVEIMANDYNMPTDSLYGGAYLKTAINVEPVPVSCAANVVEHMNFGLVKPGGSSGVIAKARAELVCTKDASIHMSVNDGSPIVEASGTKISFNYLESSLAKAGVPLGVSIEGTLERSPPTAGEYKWYAPIKITYE